MPIRSRGVSISDALDVALAIPPVDSPRNISLVDVGGNKNDTHSGNSITGFVETILDHIHQSSRVYPVLAASIQVVSNGAAHTLGVFKEIVPVDTLTVDFDIHWMSVQSVSATGEYEIVLYAGTTEIGRCIFAVSAKKDLESVPFQCEIQDANTQIQAKLSTNNAVADTCNIKLMYHNY